MKNEAVFLFTIGPVPDPVLWSCPGRECCPGGLPRHAHRNRRGAGDYPCGLSTQDESVTTASTINSTTLDAVIEALHGIGIAPEDIVTENLSVSPMYDYQYGKLGESQTVIGYQVENRLRVTVRDVNQVGAVMDAGVAAGANEAFGITFLSSNEADAADQALRAAVAEGQRKAELMAEACGKALGNLVSVNENAYGGSGGVTLKYAADAAAGTTVLANDLTVSAQVTLTYQLAE